MQSALNRTLMLTLFAGLVSAGPLAAQDDAAADPLQDIAAEMNVAAVQLGKMRTGQPAQTAQQNALKRLDELIVELEKRRAGRGGMVDPNSTRPANASRIRSGPGGMGQLHAERREGKQWAELPAKERERILQSMNEGFPSHYQRILEKYFIRLADEKAPGDVDSPERGATSDPVDAPRAAGSAGSPQDPPSSAKERP